MDCNVGVVHDLLSDDGRNLMSPEIWPSGSMPFCSVKLWIDITVFITISQVSEMCGLLLQLLVFILYSTWPLATWCTCVSIP